MSRQYKYELSFVFLSSMYFCSPLMICQHSTVFIDDLEHKSLCMCGPLVDNFSLAVFRIGHCGIFLILSYNTNKMSFQPPFSVCYKTYLLPQCVPVYFTYGKFLPE